MRHRPYRCPRVRATRVRRRSELRKGSVKGVVRRGMATVRCQRDGGDRGPRPEHLLQRLQSENGGRGCASTSARRRASARPTRCSRTRMRSRREGVDVVVGFVETYGRADTEAQLRDLEVHAAPPHRLSRRRARGDGRRRDSRAQAAAVRRRRARAHQRARAAATRSAIRTCSSCSTRGIGVHDRRQHPAPRDAERRGRPGDRRPRARDGSRHLPRPRRRSRQRRRDRRGAAARACGRERSTSPRRSSRR